jgi:3-hydroxy-9,10-secoandrosta-1,3,5(10)-triene-9,17-dione monooxygenase
MVTMTADASVRQVPTHDEIVDRARKVAIAIKDDAGTADEIKRVPEASLALVRDAQLLRVIQPRRVGGFEMSMRAHLDVIAALAEGCGSTAWVAGVGHAHSWMLGHFPDEALHEVYGDDPDTLVSAVIGPRGKAVRQTDGSHVLEGFWPFASGCQHAKWLILGAQVFDEAGEMIDEADFLLPTADVTIKDDWNVAGMQGTGSNSVTCQGVRIPPHRWLSIPALIELNTPGLEGYDGWLYRAEAVPVLALCITGSAIGIARAALPEYLRLVAGKPVMYTDHVHDDYIATHINAGSAASLIDIGEMILYRVADDIDRYAQAGERMPMVMRGRIRMDCAQGIRLLMEGVDKLFHTGGASGLSLRNALQRAWRNLHATHMHGLLAFDPSAEIYGRILLGKEPNTPIV